MRNIVLEENVVAEDDEGDGIILQQQYPWEGSDRDYDYEEVCFMFLLFFPPPLIYYIVCAIVLHVSVQLLSRVFHILRENNPELAGDRRRTVMRPPQVLREGTKKTVFVNFMDLCKTYV